MPQPTTQSEFLKLLAESKLLSREEHEELLQNEELREAESPLLLARQLVKSRVLTRYQAERLLAGRSRGFFYDNYEVLEVLGFGGMGSLYLAEDTKTGEAVALKVLNERHREDAGMLARLKLEAAAGSRLNHNNIIRTRAVNDTGAVCYVVMEFVKGINLTELLKREGPLPVATACDIICQAAEGLKYSHEQGVIHRDVKPENILVDAQGRGKLLDFGLALISGQSESEFSLAMIFGHDCVGTPDYISPEQSIDCQQVDGRTDIYGLGCTLYFLLTGQIPFPGANSKEKISARFKTKPKSLREFIPDIDKRLEKIIQKMMTMRRVERFQTMDEVIAMLRPYAERKPLPIPFNEILSERLRDARAREEHAHPSRVNPRLSSRVASASAVATAALEREMLLDTSIESDTRPSVSGVYRNWIPAESTDALAKQTTEELSANDKPALLTSADGKRNHLLNKPSVTIGRGASCDIRLDVPGISTIHCELKRAGNWWTIFDRDSKNGIAVNGIPVKEQMLWEGDTITLAQNYSFKIVDPDSGKPNSKNTLRWKWIGISIATLAFFAVLAWLLFR